MRYQSWLQWLMAIIELLGTLALVFLMLFTCSAVFVIQLAWWLIRLPFDWLVRGWRLCRG